MRHALKVRSLILTVGAFFSIPSIAQKQQARQKIVAPVLCGIVTDLTGQPVAKATVAAMWADFGTSQQVDELGRWSFGANAGPHWMRLESEGFETFIFDFVDQADPKDNGADKPAFIPSPHGKACTKPIYVRLAPANSNVGFVTLDLNKRISKEKTQ